MNQSTHIGLSLGVNLGFALWNACPGAGVTSLHGILQAATEETIESQIATMLEAGGALVAYVNDGSRQGNRDEVAVLEICARIGVPVKGVQAVAVRASSWRAGPETLADVVRIVWGFDVEGPSDAMAVAVARHQWELAA